MSEKQDKIPEMDVQTLAGEYVLGTLNAQQRAEVQQRLLHDAALRKAIDGWRSRLLTLTEMAEPATPPPRLWQRVERHLGGVSFIPTAGKSQRRKRRTSTWDNAGLWRMLAGLGLAVSVIMTTHLLGQVPNPPAPAYLSVLSTPDSNHAGWVVQASNLRGIELVPVDKSDVPPPGKVLQFWTQADDWEGPISLGLVAPGQTLKVPTDRLPPLQPNQLFELSLEKAGGSPTNKPSGPIQFAGRAVKAG